MPELIHQFSDHTTTEDGTAYVTRVYGEQRLDKTWEAWLEFAPVGGENTRRTARETVQSNRESVTYWASGLERAYLQGAIARAVPISTSTLSSSPTAAHVSHSGALSACRPRRLTSQLRNREQTDHLVDSTKAFV